MLNGIKNGWTITIESIKIFYRYPRFLIPLLLTWAIYAPLILYLKFWFNPEVYPFWLSWLILVGIIFAFTSILAYSCSMLLELIQQLESGQKMSITKAFEETLHHNAVRILPIVITWTIIWFVLLIIQALLSRDRDKEKRSVSAENAARALAGYKDFTLSQAFFDALHKGIRMIVFLILPAIAWENHGFKEAIKRGLGILKANLSTFITGFVLTGFLASIIFLPPGILFYLSDEYKIQFSDNVWIMTILYTAFAWSYSIYLEQMFTAELYLWHMKWEKLVKKAQEEGKEPPLLKDVPKPSMLDNISELLN